ncbi:DUF6092 family protein [Chloroflexota bacterium]
MSSPAVEAEFTALICYLICSARGLVGEPKLYGPSRLVEAARRLIHLADACGIHHATLEEVAQQIEENRLAALAEGEEALVRLLDTLVDLLAVWLRDTSCVRESGNQQE